MAGPFASVEGLYLSREFSVYIVPTSVWDHWKGDDGSVTLSADQRRILSWNSNRYRDLVVVKLSRKPCIGGHFHFNHLRPTIHLFIAKTSVAVFFLNITMIRLVCNL
jgi:hypothetical protein